MAATTLGSAQVPGEVEGFDEVAAIAGKRETVRVIARLANPQPDQPMSASSNSRAALTTSGLRCVRSASAKVEVPWTSTPNRTGGQRTATRGVASDGSSRGCARGCAGPTEIGGEHAPDRCTAGRIPRRQWIRLGRWRCLIRGCRPTIPSSLGGLPPRPVSSSTSSSSTTLCPNGLEAQTGTGAGVNCPLSVEGCAHGTHVAGITAGRAYSGGPSYNGVAPQGRDRSDPSSF